MNEVSNGRLTNVICLSLVCQYRELQKVRLLYFSVVILRAFRPEGFMHFKPILRSVSFRAGFSPEESDLSFPLSLRAHQHSKALLVCKWSRD